MVHETTETKSTVDRFLESIMRTLWDFIETSTILYTYRNFDFILNISEEALKVSNSKRTSFYSTNLFEWKKIFILDLA